MSDISQYLAAINSAIYGKDVRDAIHDAIETMNDDCESLENDWQDFKEDITGMSGNVDESIDVSLLDLRYDTEIASNANVNAAENYACIATFVPVTANTVVKVGSLQANIFHYTLAGVSSYTTQSGYIDSDYTVENAGFIRVSIRKDSTASSEVTESDILTNIRIYLPEFRYNRLNGLHNCLDMENVDYYKGLTQSDGVPILSEVCAMFKRFSVSPDKVYYFRMTATENNAQAVIFAYDSDGEFVTTGRSAVGSYKYYTIMASSSSRLSQSQVIVFSDDIKYIDVMYHFKTITSISLETYMAESEILSQRLQATNDVIDDLDRKCYYTSRNNSTYVDEIVNVAKSYYNQKDENDNYRMHYDSSNTVLTEAGYNGKGGIDCSTYVGLILRGIPFEDTDYATGTQSGEGGSSDQDADDDSSGTIKKQYNANPDYEWSINPHDYEFAESPFSINKHPVRSAASMAYWMECMGRRVWIDDHLANLLPGDIVFFARKDSTTDEWIQPNRYKHISHVAIITGKIAAPQDANWDTTKYPYAHEMYEVTGTPGACTYRTFENANHSNIYSNGTGTLVMIARPDLGSI